MINNNIENQDLQKESNKEVKNRTLKLLLGLILISFCIFIISSLFKNNEEISISEDFENNKQEDILEDIINIDDVEVYNNNSEMIGYQDVEINLQTGEVFRGEVSETKYGNEEYFILSQKIKDGEYNGIEYENTDTIKSNFDEFLISEDSQRILVRIGRYSAIENREIGDMRVGEFIGHEDYLCFVDIKKCEKTNDLKMADALVTEKGVDMYRYHGRDNINFWNDWNSENNLIGFYHGDGGSNLPVVKFDISKKEVEVLPDSLGNAVIYKTFNSDKSKFYIYTEGFRDEPPVISIYETDNPSVPLNTINVSLIDSYPQWFDSKIYVDRYSENYVKKDINKIHWSGNDLIVKTHLQSYKINIENGDIILLSDANQIRDLFVILFDQHFNQPGYDSWIPEYNISPTGQYGYFVERQYDTLIVVDLFNNNETKQIDFGNKFK